jgi:hypothetical protein
MKALMISKLVMVALMALMMTARAMAFETPRQTPQQKIAVAVEKRVIVVSLLDRKLALIVDGQVKKIYTVAVGKPSTPSPVGTYTIERRAANPTYHHNGKTVLPGPSNPVGTRWMGLSITGYGIHGTNEPKSIGKAASHGCIRMARVDLEEFYELVAVGDTVELIGERNEETAKLFGDPEKPAAEPVAQPTQLAMNAPATAPQVAAQAGTAQQSNQVLIAMH